MVKMASTQMVFQADDQMGAKPMGLARWHMMRKFANNMISKLGSNKDEGKWGI